MDLRKVYKLILTDFPKDLYENNRDVLIDLIGTYEIFDKNYGKFCNKYNSEDEYAKHILRSLLEMIKNSQMF